LTDKVTPKSTCYLFKHLFRNRVAAGLVAPRFCHRIIYTSGVRINHSPQCTNANPIAGKISKVIQFSPRVLDIALYPLSQGIAFEMMVSYLSTVDGGEDHERFRMTFDPDTEYGRDLFIEFESEPLLSTKEYRRSLEVTMGSDYWLRQQARLYDPASIKLIELSLVNWILARVKIHSISHSMLVLKRRYLWRVSTRILAGTGVLQHFWVLMEHAHRARRCLAIAGKLNLWTKTISYSQDVGAF
jgi:hypothetical protein